jgi:hypothetical protein
MRRYPSSRLSGARSPTTILVFAAAISASALPASRASAASDALADKAVYSACWQAAGRGFNIDPPRFKAARLQLLDSTQAVIWGFDDSRRPFGPPEAQAAYDAARAVGLPGLRTGYDAARRQFDEALYAEVSALGVDRHSLLMLQILETRVGVITACPAARGAADLGIPALFAAKAQALQPALRQALDMHLADSKNAGDYEDQTRGFLGGGSLNAPGTATAAMIAEIPRNIARLKAAEAQAAANKVQLAAAAEIRRTQQMAVSGPDAKAASEAARQAYYEAQTMGRALGIVEKTNFGAQTNLGPLIMADAVWVQAPPKCAKIAAGHFKCSYSFTIQRTTTTLGMTAKGDPISVPQTGVLILANGVWSSPDLTAAFKAAAAQSARESTSGRSLNDRLKESSDRFEQDQQQRQNKLDFNADVYQYFSR